MAWDWAGTREAKVAMSFQPIHPPCSGVVLKPCGFADDSHLLEQSEGVRWELMGQLGDR